MQLRGRIRSAYPALCRETVADLPRLFSECGPRRHDHHVQAGRSLHHQERSIIDAVPLRHIEVTETAVEALRRRLRQPVTQLNALLAMARAFPKAEPALRLTFVILRRPP